MNRQKKPARAWLIALTLSLTASAFFLGRTGIKEAKAQIITYVCSASTCYGSGRSQDFNEAMIAAEIDLINECESFVRGEVSGCCTTRTCSYVEQPDAWIYVDCQAAPWIQNISAGTRSSSGSTGGMGSLGGGSHTGAYGGYTGSGANSGSNGGLWGTIWKVLGGIQ